MFYQLNNFPDNWIYPALILAGLALLLTGLALKNRWLLLLAIPPILAGGIMDRDLSLMACSLFIIFTLWHAFKNP